MAKGNLKIIIDNFKRQIEFESTLSSCRVYSEMVEDSCIVKVFHRRSSLAYGFDSDMYNESKQRDMKKAKDNFTSKLIKEGYTYEMLNYYTYKIKK